MKHPRITNQHIRRLGDGTARIAFEIQPPLRDGALDCEILREKPDGSCFHSNRDGLLPKVDSTSAIVAVSVVRQRDVLIMRFHNKSGLMVLQDRLRFSDSFVAKPEEMKAGACAVACSSHRAAGPGAGNLHHMPVEDLTRLFRDRHPEWLQQRLEAALDSWKNEMPELFARVAPRARIVHDLSLLVNHAPQRALSEFSTMVNREQFAECIRREPFPAVQHVFACIPREIRVGLVRKFATFCLNHHLNRLTEKELEAASFADAKTAFPLRHFADGQRHAIMTSVSYPACFFMERHVQGSEFRREMKDSVLAYPRVWWRTHQQSFTILFSALSSTLGIHFSGEELLLLSRKLGPELRAELRKHIVCRI
jgi:hypothetical protein